MNNVKLTRKIAVIAAWVTLVTFCSLPLTARAEDTFPVLQIGTQTYSNVTVTTKNTNYIFILHSTGMASIKVADLPNDLKEQLGYHVPPPKLPPAENAKVIAKMALAKVETPTVKAAEAKVADAWRDNIATRLPRINDYPPRVLWMGLGGVFLVHLLFSFCCYSICTKAGTQPGILVWLPLFQTIPLVRAAGMSGWWFLACFIPVLNIVAGIIWAVKIVNARNLNVFVTILLLLPGLNLLGFLILAFASTHIPVKDQRKTAEIMSLEPV